MTRGGGRAPLKLYDGRAPLQLEGAPPRPFGPDEAPREEQAAPTRVRSLIGPLPQPGALPEIRQFLRDQRQAAYIVESMNVNNFIDDLIRWETPGPYVASDRKDRNTTFSGEASGGGSGSGSGKRASYSAGHIQS